jgi:hypothetical protein
MSWAKKGRTSVVTLVERCIRATFAWQVLVPALVALLIVTLVEGLVGDWCWQVTIFSSKRCHVFVAAEISTFGRRVVVCNPKEGAAQEKLH